MARFEISGDELVLNLTGWEKVEGFHGDIRVPLSSVREVKVVEDPWPELRGVRAPGTGIPHVIAVGTRIGSGGRDFAAVHGRGPAVMIDLEGARWQRLLATIDDASSVAAGLRGRLGLGELDA